MVQRNQILRTAIDKNLNMEQIDEDCKSAFSLIHQCISSIRTMDLTEEQKKSKCKIHLFPDTTAPLMFVLGARTIVPGVLQLYEYNPKEDSYTMSLIRGTD